MARRGQRRALSAPDARGPRPRRAAASASITARTSCFSTWAAGGCVVPLDYLTARDVIRAVERHEISTLAGVPPLWVQLIEAPWPAAAALSLRRLTNSGGKLAPSVVRRMREVFPAADIYSMYGLTEAFRSTYLEPALLDAHPEFDGQRHPLRRDHGGRRRRQRGGGGRAGPCRAAGRQGLLAGSGAHRRAVQAGAGRLGLWRHGGLVGRPGAPRRRGPALFRRPRGRDDQDLGQPGQPDRGRGGGDRLRPGRRGGGARLSRRAAGGGDRAGRPPRPARRGGGACAPS